MREFIIESALLTHGLKSISSERLKQELDKKWICVSASGSVRDKTA